MLLPLENLPIFIYSFYGLIAVSLLIVKSVNIALDGIRKGLDNAN